MCRLVYPVQLYATQKYFRGLRSIRKKNHENMKIFQ